MDNQLNRRQAIGLMGMTALGAAAGRTFAQSSEAAPTPPRGSFRIAHLTDFHVQPERRGNEGMIACLRHVQSLERPPELILTGGDCVFDSFEANDARTQLQWDLYQTIFKSECSVNVRGCIGNHDIWGWRKSKSGCTGAEPNYGKKRATEMLGLAKPYESFDAGPANNRWHFVLLDSTQTDGGEGYRAFLDDEQFDWLERDLKAVHASTPIVVLSHIPIMSASAPLFAKRNEKGDATVSGSLVHLDSYKIVSLFAHHPNVTLCLSGHLHHIERADYNGVTYLCNGAVSGNWWKGRHHECDEGYAVIDLNSDGSFTHQYLTYGWKAQPEG